jgi:hypothetical protein
MSADLIREIEWSKYLKLVSNLRVYIDDNSFNRERLSEEEESALLAVFPAMYKNLSFKSAGLSISKAESTIKSQFTSIYRKLEIDTKIELYEKLQSGFNKYLEGLSELPRDNAVWDMLLNLAINATDRFGIVYPPNIPKMGMAGDYSRHQQKRIQTKIPKEKHILLEIPEGLNGFLIVLEDHASSDDIYLLAPSHWLENSQIDGKPIHLPKPATPDYRGMQLETLGETQLWAGVFDALPDWEWLQPLQDNFRSLDASRLQQLLDYAKSQPRESKTLLRSSYTVVAN